MTARPNAPSDILPHDATALVCFGGAIGSGARYLLSGWLLRLAGPGFPYGTLAVNVIGSFRLGLTAEGLVSMEKVRIVKYSPGTRPVAGPLP